MVFAQKWLRLHRIKTQQTLTCMRKCTSANSDSTRECGDSNHSFLSVFLPLPALPKTCSVKQGLGRDGGERRHNWETLEDTAWHYNMLTEELYESIHPWDVIAASVCGRVSPTPNQSALLTWERGKPWKSPLTLSPTLSNSKQQT